MASPNHLDPGDKFFAAFIAVCLTVFALLAVVIFIVIEAAIWGAGITNGLVWHGVLGVIAWISSFVYKWIIKKGNWNL